MTRLRSPAFAAANGQFLLFRRDAYLACGGHAAVRANVLEDVGLARAVKAAGYRIALADGNGLVTCRMYGSAREVWAGFSKNLFAFFNRSWLFLSAALGVCLVLWVLPPFWALAALLGLLPPPDSAPASTSLLLVVLPLAQYALAVLTRLVLARRFGDRLLDTLLHPLSVALLLAISLNSARLSRRGGVTWKGRPVG